MGTQSQRDRNHERLLFLPSAHLCHIRISHWKRRPISGRASLHSWTGRLVWTNLGFRWLQSNRAEWHHWHLRSSFSKLFATISLPHSSPLQAAKSEKPQQDDLLSPSEYSWPLQV